MDNEKELEVKEIKPEFLEAKSPEGRVVQVTEHAFEVIYKSLGYELIKKKAKKEADK